MARIETVFRVAAVALSAAMFALPASAEESRRNHSSGSNGNATRPSAPQGAAPRFRGAPPAVTNPSFSNTPHARPPHHNPGYNRGFNQGYGNGWIGTRPIYNPPLAVYPAPRIGYIAPPVVYSPPPVFYSAPPRYYVESAPIYSSPSYQQGGVIAPHGTEQPVWYYCADYRDYYPNVEQCPSNWLRVLPDATEQPQPQQ